MSMDILFLKIKEFFLKHEQKIVLVVAFCLISAISYEFGAYKAKNGSKNRLLLRNLLIYLKSKKAQIWAILSLLEQF